MAWNGSTSTGKSGTGPTKPNKIRPKTGSVPILPRLRWLFFSAVLAAAVVATWWFVVRNEETPAAPEKTRHGGAISEVKPNVVTPGDQVGGAALPGAADAEKQEDGKEDKKPGVFAPGMIRLPNGYELRFKLPAEGETRQLLAGGEIWEVDSKGNIENITPPPIFEKPFEGMISSLYERDGMVLPFALKGYSEEEVRRMCKEPTLSYDDDTEDITRKRENVVMLKKAILEFLDGGGTFEEFVDDMLQHSQKAQRAQVEGMHGVRDLLLSGKDKEAVLYYRLFSQDMADKGYGELKLPPSYRAALEEAEAKEKGRK